MSSQKRRIVVIGGSNAGIGVSHGLLKQISDIKVTLVNPSNEYYFNIAAPRFLTKPDLLDPSKYIYSIPEVFEKYPSDSFQFIQAKATCLDLENQLVHLNGPNELPIPYDYLIIASGSTTPATIGKESFPAPFKIPEGKLSAAIRDTQLAVQRAQSIIIGGAGPIGVEFAGEIAEAFENDGVKKNITLISGTDNVLAGVKSSVQNAAAQLLRDKGISLKTLSRIQKADFDPASDQWRVTLSNGEILTADLFVSAMGTLPNNDFIPQSLLTSKGWVDVDEHLRVKDHHKEEARPNIFALGDITSFPERLLLRVQPQIQIVVANLKKEITGNGDLSSYHSEDQKTIMVVPVGRSTGTGVLGNWRMFGFLVSFFKGRDFLTGKAASFISG